MAALLHYCTAHAALPSVALVMPAAFAAALGCSAQLACAQRCRTDAACFPAQCMSLLAALGCALRHTVQWGACWRAIDQT